MVELNTKVEKLEEIIELVKDGMLIVHEETSGFYLMLKMFIESFKKDCSNPKICEKTSYFSISQAHPTFQELIKVYKIKHLPAILWVRNSDVEELIESPISKSSLIKRLLKIQTSA